MKKMNTSPISGMLELLPNEQAVFNKYKREVEEVFHRHGFLAIETPTIEREEILFAKAGGETEKQIYKVIKTEETTESADQALRFDHTVPLARYVTEHESDLSFPFRVTQTGKNYRGERAQKGRFREFYQLDIDVVGRNELAIEYDIDVILTLVEALGKMGLEKVLVRVSNRKILGGFIEEMNLQEVSNEIFSIIDHAEKVPAEKTREKLVALEIGEEKIERLLDFIEISGDKNRVEEKLRAFMFENQKFNEGVDELSRVLGLLETQLSSEKVIADMKIVRGLDYYTGTVFETILPEYDKIGSICSGGRYENLTELYSDQKFPGVGGSIGLTRLFSVLRDLQLVEPEAKKPVDFAIIPVDEEAREASFQFAEKLRKTGNSVDLVLSDKKFVDKLKYAAKVAKFGIVLGENELKSGKIMKKDFSTGEETELSVI
ncbi:histidine--tRNA ligase [Candidatus Saccharibacteria bacterium]|nr:histidine--tRNA ligase [Candidatus Saccharibacteria bacterium]